MSYDIMVDIDDVIVPWFETVDAKCRKTWDTPANHPPCQSWHMWEHYGRSRKEWTEVVISCVADGLYHSIEPLPYAKEAVNLLRWDGHRVHIVTARGFMASGGNIREWTPAYLQEFGIGYDTLTFAKDKVAAQSELGARFDFAIDDGVHNFTALQADGVNVALHTAPHNVDFETPHRVGSLWEFARRIVERAA